MTDNRLLEEKYYELTMLDKQGKELLAQQEQFDNQLVELDISIQALKTLEETKEGTKLLVPICPGIFVDAQVGHTDKVVVNVGSDVAVAKTIDEGIQILKKQRASIREYLNLVQDHLEKIQNKVNDIERLMRSE